MSMKAFSSGKGYSSKNAVQCIHTCLKFKNETSYAITSSNFYIIKGGKQV